MTSYPTATPPAEADTRCWCGRALLVWSTAKSIWLCPMEWAHIQAEISEWLESVARKDGAEDPHAQIVADGSLIVLDSASGRTWGVRLERQ